MKRILTAFSATFVVCAIPLFSPESSVAQCGSLAATVVPYQSRCVATGSIVVNASGGVAPATYQYLLSDGPVTTSYSSIDTFSGLPPGTYTVVIKDVNAGCTITEPNIVVTGNYTAPGIFYNSTEPTCMNGTDGTIFVTSESGGRAPFSYQLISPSPSQVGTVSSTGSFTGLIPGLYYIQMTDSCGGIQTRTQLVKNYTWSILNSSNVTNTCQNITASIYLTNSNGINSPNAVYAGFQYGISLSPGDTTWFSSSSFNFNLGQYRGATILAEDNCGNVQSFYWAEPAATVNANVNVSNETCTTFTATITGQQNLNAAFTQYCLYDSTNTILSSCQNSPEFDNLPYGTYNIRITDSCYDTTIVRTVTASVPSPTVDNNPQIIYSCTSFSATITGQTDTSNTTYCIYENGNPIPDTCNSTGIFDSLAYGTNYCVQMHSSSACSDTVITRCFIINKLQPSVNSTVSFSNNTCTTFAATITGQQNLTNPIYRLFNSANNTQIGPDQTSPSFNLLPYGSYCIDIINDSSCYDTTIVVCFTESAPDINISLSAKGSCTLVGATDIKVSFNSGISPFIVKLYSPESVLLYTDTTSQSNYTYVNLPGLANDSLYKVIAMDSCGFSDSATVASAVYYFNRAITVTPQCPSGTSPNGTGDVTVVVTENRGGAFTTKIISQNGIAFNQNPNSTISSGNTYTFKFLSLSPATYIFDTYSQNCGTDFYDTVTVSDYTYPNLSNSTGYICDNSAQTVNSVTVGGLGPFQYQIFGSAPDTPSINTPYQSSPYFSIANGTPYSLIRLRVLDACANASINDVGFISVATPAINVTAYCLLGPTTLSVDSISGATYLWYRRTYNPTDSVFVDSGSVYNIPVVTLADTGVYISKTIINSGCEIRDSYTDITDDSLACSVVPVKLESFNAIKDDEHSLLNWVTSNELNIKVFYVERSLDNGNTWQKIGNVIASPNNLSNQSYSFTDNDPQNGMNLYRLQIVNNNGDNTYSNIARVNLLVMSTMVIFPNPLRKEDNLNIQLVGLNAGTYKISIISASGQTIKEVPFNIDNTSSTLLMLPSTNLASGSYDAIVNGNGLHYSKPFVIIDK